MAEFMLSTVDNPYNPFTQWDAWYRFDQAKGYDTCGYLARFAHTSDSMSEEENERETERAIDEIMKYNFLGLYQKVSEPKFNASPA